MRQSTWWRRGSRPGRGVTAAAVATAAASLLPFVSAPPAQAALQPRPLMTGWMPYWTTNQSIASYAANRDLFADISPFWHDTAAAGNGRVAIVNHLSRDVRAARMRQLRTLGKPIIPSVTDGTGAHYMSGVLASASTRRAHVSQLVDVVLSNGYDGIDLDYEQFAFADGQSSWSATRVRWAAFVKELAAALHARGKLLTAAVPTSGYWVYDFAMLGATIDRVRVMTYDWSVSDPGPIAPVNWVAKETDWMLARIPARKLYMGVPTYGRDWAVKSVGTCPTGATKKKVVDAVDTYTLARTYGATPRRDASSGEVTFSYWRTYVGEGAEAGRRCSVQRVVWGADANTVLARADKVLARGAAGIATWTVGSEDPKQWAPLRTRAWVRTPSVPTLAAFVAPLHVARGAHAYPKARASAGGKYLTGTRVVLSQRQLGTSIWTPVQARTTDANGLVVFDVVPRSTVAFRIEIAPGLGRLGLVKQSMTPTIVG